jgi:histidyl-tRNA synthetase
MRYSAPRGTSDILEPDIQVFNNIFNKSREIFNLFGFNEISTPIFEDSRLFIRSLGEVSEIVNKQMLNLATKENPLTLRPEGTAGIIRAFLEHHLDKEKGFAKLFYIGPMFRAERPQKGRLRQFTHIGAEAIGSIHPGLDAEILVLVTRLLNNLGVKGYTIILNSVGCEKDKAKLNSLLKKELEKKKSDLCEDCRDRLNRNVLRILDCKNESCRKLVQAINFENEFRCSDCNNHFQAVKNLIKQQQIDFQESSFLVRGLDYYTGTVFEVTHPDLGSQDAIGAGGRYNNLVSQLGGPELGAVGFALGVERLILALKSKQAQLPDNQLDVFLVVTSEDLFSQGLSILTNLRDCGIRSDIDYTNRSLKAQMRLANNLNVRFVLILGEEEAKNKFLSLKDMKVGTQEKFPLEQIVGKIKELLQRK